MAQAPQGSNGVAFIVSGKLKNSIISFRAVSDRIISVEINTNFTSISDAKTRPGADCDTDHILTTAKLRLKTFRMPKTSNAPIRYNLDRFGNAQTANECAVTTDNRFQVLLDEWERKPQPTTSGMT